MRLTEAGEAGAVNTVRRRLVASVASLAFLAAAASVARADSTEAEIYFRSGAQKFFVGDLEGTVPDLETALRFDPTNRKVKAFLVKVLVDLSSKQMDKRDYAGALHNLEKAKRFAPENPRVKELYDTVYAEVHPRAAQAQPSAPGGAPVMVAPSPVAEATIKEMFGTFSKQQEKLVEQYAGPISLLREQMTKSGEERKELFGMLQKKEEAAQQTLRRTFLFGIGGFVLALIVVIAAIYMVLHFVSVRREGLLMQHQERILNMMQQQNLALSQGQAGSRLMLTQGASTRQLLEDPNPLIRAKGVEVIEAELVEEKDNEVATRLLDPFLKDDNNRVRANAAKAVYRYNRDLALSTLREMMESSDKWMRVSAVWAFGEIGDLEGVEVLLQLAKDGEYHVRRRVYKSLQKVLEQKKDEFSSDLKSRTDRVMKELEAEVKEGA